VISGARIAELLVYPRAHWPMRVSVKESERETLRDGHSSSGKQGNNQRGGGGGGGGGRKQSGGGGLNHHAKFCPARQKPPYLSARKESRTRLKRENEISPRNSASMIGSSSSRPPTSAGIRNAHYRRPSGRSAAAAPPASSSVPECEYANVWRVPTCGAERSVPSDGRDVAEYPDQMN